MRKRKGIMVRREGREIKRRKGVEEEEKGIRNVSGE